MTLHQEPVNTCVPHRVNSSKSPNHLHFLPLKKEFQQILNGSYKQNSEAPGNLILQWNHSFNKVAR